MLSRRDLLSGVVIGSPITGHRGAERAGAPMPGEQAVAPQSGQISERSGQDIVQALKDLRSAITAPQSFPEIQPVRTKQVDFLRGQGRFPDYIDVGVDIWFGVYDWHVRHLQPITLGRDVSGRYTLTLMTTTLVLRMDADVRYVGVAYDTVK